MKFFQQHPFRVLAAVLVWRLLLLVFTVQPIPANDAFGYDGAVVNLLHGGRYVNPSFALLFPISGREIYATYPPLYQGALWIWMKLFGPGVVSAMALHLGLFAGSAALTLAIIKRFFPAGVGYALAAFFLFGFTFGDRPEDLAYIFGLGSLWLVAEQISAPRPRLAAAVALGGLLLLALYTSVIVGAYFFGAGFLAFAFAFLWRRNFYWFAPFIAVAAGFCLITGAIAKFEPVWWAGFMESARQQTVMSAGVHIPRADALIRLARTVPVFLVGLVALPILFRRRPISVAPWLALVVGTFAMGWVLLIASVTFLASTYVNYAGFTQIMLAAGLLALTHDRLPLRERPLRLVLAACVVLVSIRAIGMSTWGAVCAAKNSYHSTQAVLQTELAPFTNSDAPVLISSAYLYRAVDMRVKNPVHCDWYFDHATWTNNVQMAGLISCRPPRLVLTQFDYYRAFAAPLAQLEQRPDLVTVRVRDLAAVPVPDASPSLQRVVQHISWAPVIVDLDWRPVRP